MIPKLASKLPELETSIFSKMSLMATETGAINLSQGFPDFGVDPTLIRLMQKSLEGSFNQYAPMGGIFSLREAIAQKTSRLYGASYHPESEITLTAGATQAIYAAIATGAMCRGSVRASPRRNSCPLTIGGPGFPNQLGGLFKDIEPPDTYGYH